MKAAQIPSMEAILRPRPINRMRPLRARICLERAILEWSFEVEEVWINSPVDGLWITDTERILPCGRADEWTFQCYLASMELVDSLLGYVNLDRETITQTLNKIEADLVSGVFS